ncbi:MAG: cytochrome c oxidase subunit II transmembrane domain-containing protein, partial [Pseudobdellovibrionaceae bacterium]
MIWWNVANAQSFMPTEGTEIASQVNNLYGFLLISSAIGCAILIGGMVYFVWKYKRKTDNDKTAYISHNTTLEFLWSFIPLVLFLVVFGWGWVIYHDMRAMPKNALEIHVYGKQWAWEMEYKSGVKTSNLMVAPVNTDVKLIMTATDVLH